MEEIVFGRRYRATEKIGTGGMADVFKAVDEVLGRTVAVKVMHPRYAADPAFAARFRQEAQAAANLVSPNIVNIYDWGADEDTYYIVMEYVRGNDLKTLIQQQDFLPSRKVADIGAQVCSALSVAHGYDIIHRDIKPHNIMVQPDGSVKVMDFGIARAGNSTMTQTGSVLGTAHYVSPEQAQGKELQATSDLYSLGIVLFESATGRLPFDADTPVAVALKQVNEQPPAPRSLNSQIDPGLEAIIVKAMQKNPAARYQSADEMRKDLLAVAAGNAPTNAGALAGGAVAVAAAGADSTTVLPSVAGPQAAGYGRTPNRRPAPKKRPVWPWILVAVALVAAGFGVAWAAGVFAPKTIGVPDLTGKTVAEATVLLQGQGLAVGQQTLQNDDTVPLGKIISQSPQAGSTVDKGSLVALVVSKGPQMLQVPKVIGLADSDAIQTLQDAGFVPVAGPSRYDNTVPVGKVVEQNPAPDTQAVKGSQVTYVVSKGTQMSVVPDVTNMKKSDAISALENAGFRYTSSTDFSDSVDSGRVISQDPSAGGSYPPKTTVSITVSLGKGATVPSVFGLDWLSAKNKIESAGLVISPSSVTSGSVDSQSPKADKVVSPGTKVTCTFK